jgi:hypothetical protein
MRRFPVLVLFVALGCAKNGDEGMVVLANTAPSGTSCTFTGDPTQPAFSQGEIYAGVTDPNPYLLTPLIESRITAAGSGENVDRSILLQGADVTLTASSNGKSVSLPSSAQFTTTIAGTVEPGGFLNVSFPIVPTDVLSLFETGSADTEIVANVVIFGDEGGGRVNAEPFDYQVTVCPAGAPCVVQDAGPCATFTGTVSTGNPCNPLQDGVLTCCEGSDGGGLVCPAS